MRAGNPQRTIPTPLEKTPLNRGKRRFRGWVALLLGPLNCQGLIAQAWIICAFRAHSWCFLEFACSVRHGVIRFVGWCGDQRV